MLWLPHEVWFVCLGMASPSKHSFVAVLASQLNVCMYVVTYSHTQDTGYSTQCASSQPALSHPRNKNDLNYDTLLHLPFLIPYPSHLVPYNSPFLSLLKHYHILFHASPFNLLLLVECGRAYNILTGQISLMYHLFILWCTGLARE